MLPSERLIKIAIPFPGGLDESSPVDDVALEDALKMENYRISPDGKRVQKRLGSTDQSLGESEDVYGQHFYYQADGTYADLVILESEIRRYLYGTRATGTSIHTWSTNIAHPVKPLEIQGKQFIITEEDSRFIHTNEADYQIGIDAPTTIPTLATGYAASIMEENCDGIGDWADVDAGSGASSQVGFDGKSTFRFLNTGTAGDEAKRSKYVPNNRIPAKMAIETSIYMNTIGSKDATDDFAISFNTGNGRFGLAFDVKEISVVNGTTYPTDYIQTGVVTRQDDWMDIKMFYDSTDPDDRFLEFWLDDEYKGRYTIDDTYSGLTGSFFIECYGETASTDVYVNYLNISDTGSASLLGKYRYAVSYARSGNFSNESNPIKSFVGAATHTGSGLDDLTPGGTYTGDIDRNVQVRIDGTGGYDSCEVSYDAGETWASTDLLLKTTMYLNYGIELTWGAFTGHTLADYWDFTCSSLAIIATNNQITLASIPTPSDAQASYRKIFRTTAGGSKYYWLATIPDSVTTSFLDNFPDISLGTEMREDWDVLPDGKFSCWWDDRLWVSGDNIVYYSQIDNPEAFDIDVRYITIRKGERGNDITQMIDYRDALYVFKKNCIFIIVKRSGGGYGRYLIEKDVGCVAPWSMIEVNGFLMFLSSRGIELYNGETLSPPNFSIDVKRTIDAIDQTKLDLIDSCHNRAFNEVWWSIPDDSSGTTTKTLVYNTIKNKFYIFSRADSEIISCLSETEDLNKVKYIYIGTRSGKLFTADSGYQDGSTSFTCTLRKKWLDQGQVGTARRLEVEYEIPNSKTLTSNIYVDFDKDVARTDSHTGVSLNATDIELRRVIKDQTELGLEGRWFSLEFTNAENLGGDLKVNKALLYFTPRARKDKKYGD